VVKLAQSGVDASVILAYIKNSSGPFQPSAEEILRLRDLGISSAVLTAMLERGGELRRQAPPAPPVSYPGYSLVAPAPATQSAATYAESVPVEAGSTEPASSVAYIGASYPVYTYPYYSTYWYYPWSYCGYYPYRYWGHYPYRYCGYYPYHRSGSHPSHYSGSRQDFPFHSHPDYYPWYSRDGRPGTAAHHGRTGANPQGNHRNGGLPIAYAGARSGGAPVAGNARGPVAVARPVGARVVGGGPVSIAAPRSSGVPMGGARVSNPRFVGGGGHGNFGAPRVGGAQMSGVRLGSVQMSGPRMGGMPAGGARFSGGGMRHR
jgi:hypothetical protein